MRKTRGFTLIEILIALFVFAIMATIASVALRRIFVNKQILSAHIAQMNQLQMAVAIFRLDLTQAIDRPIRDNGGSIGMAFTGSNSSITFTRTGNINPLAYYRISNLQRITYTAGGSLARGILPVLDNAPSTHADTKILLKDISNGTFAFYNDKMQRFTSWPLPKSQNQSNSGQTQNPLPAAVELQFTVKGLGPIDVLVPIYAGNLHPQHQGSANAAPST